ECPGLPRRRPRRLHVGCVSKTWGPLCTAPGPEPQPAVEELSPRCQTGSMRIAFLGTGRMGTELALHLLSDHQLTVWNRTREKTSRLAEAGASVADSPAGAVTGLGRAACR